MTIRIEFKGATVACDNRDDFRIVLEELGLREAAPAPDRSSAPVPTAGEGRTVIAWSMGHVASLWSVLNTEQKKLLLDVLPHSGKLTAAFSDATNGAHPKGGVGKRLSKINELVTAKVSASLPRPVRLDGDSGGDRILQVDPTFAAVLAEVRDNGVDLS
jgi:hypothetical protein